MTSYLLAAALCCWPGAAEPMEASFCDMWPLAVGNKWVDGSGGFVGSTITTTEIVAQETRNGYTAWHILTTIEDPFGERSAYTYFAFVNGWVYGTGNEADLDALPEIGGGLIRFLPEVFQDGQTYAIEGGSSAPITVTVVFRSTDMLELVHETYPFLRLIRGQGPAQIDTGFPFYPSTFTIVGTCSGLYESQISTVSSWVMVGQAIRLAVPGSSGPRFQWYKDGAPIEDASLSTYLKDPAALEDSGSYACRIWDPVVAFHDTKAVFVEVFPEGSLPVAGTAGLAVLAVVLTAMTYARIRNAHKR